MANSDTVYRYFECRPDSYHGWYNQARQLQAHSKLEDALYSYQKALEYHPHDYFSWYNHGKILEELGQYQSALNSFHQAGNLQPNNYWAWYSIGYILQEKLADYSQAMVYLRRALVNNPQDYWTNYRLAKSYFYQRKYISALDFFHRALNIRPHDYWSLYRCGECWQKIGNLTSARNAYLEALEVKNNDYWTIFKLMNIAEKQCLYAEVIIWGKILLDLDFESEEIISKLVIASQILNKPEESLIINS